MHCLVIYNKKRITDNQPVRVVATSVVEATRKNKNS